MIPTEIATTRLILRCWRPADAAPLHTILEQNLDHLRPWIPEAVYAPAPIPEIEERLRSYASDFAAHRAWRFAVVMRGSSELLGEASLFPRSADRRVSLDEADRVEIGYWLRTDATGRGFASEAAQALIAVGLRLPGIASAEIRCDSRNEPSAAIPRRLGFVLAPEKAAGTGADMVWRLPRPLDPLTATGDCQ